MAKVVPCTLSSSSRSCAQPHSLPIEVCLEGVQGRRRGAPLQGGRPWSALCSLLPAQGDHGAVDEFTFSPFLLTVQRIAGARWWHKGRGRGEGPLARGPLGTEEKMGQAQQFAPPLVGAIDQGTTSSRFFVFDAAGRTVASCQRAVRLHTPHAG